MKILKNLEQKKGISLDMMAGVAVTFVITAVVIGIGATIVNSVGSGLTANSYAKNATVYGEKGLDELASWIPTVAIIVAAVIIIGLVVSFQSRAN